MLGDVITNGAVVYAKDIARVSGFYAAVTTLDVVETAPAHVVLRSSGYELVVVEIPAEIATTFEISDPPHRRSDTAVKLGFTVSTTLAAAREAAHEHGGELDLPDREWEWNGARVCDGQDPEGNVIQLRERA